MPIAFAACGVTWWLLAQPIFRLRKAGMPEHAFFSGGTNAGLAVMAVSLIITCIGIGFLAANSLVWIIPPLRRFFERDAQKTGTPGFARSAWQLLQFTGVTMAVFYPIALLGGMNYFAATAEGLFYRPWLALSPDHYAWNDVTGIETQCFSKHRGLYGHFTLSFGDGTTVDLAPASIRDFMHAYPRFAPLLKGKPFHVLPPPSPMVGACPPRWRRYFEEAP